MNGTHTSPTWTPQHATQIQTRLEKDVFPYLGSSPITDIEPPAILKCLRRVEERGAVDTAKRIKTDISCVFRFAVATGRATRDQTADLKGALKPTQVKNHAAITDPQEVGKLLRAIADYHGNATTIAALQLCAYLFQRPGEIRKMVWDEVNTENALWTIPADRMKRRKEYIVPLPRQALAILAELKPLTGKFAYVFPAVGNPYQPLNKNTLPKAIHLMGFDSNTMTAHGFRAMASTLLYERGYPSDVIEKQLAHAVENDVRRAYDRSQHIEQRTTMMQQWADYLDGLRDGVTM